MATNPAHAPVTPVSWFLEFQDDGASQNSTETYYPDGVIIAEPLDESETVGSGDGRVTLFRSKRTLRMIGGRLAGDLPADVEGTGWTWRVTATVTWTNGQNVRRTRNIGPFYVSARKDTPVDLAEAVKGQIVGDVWTTQGREGVSVTTISLAEGNVLRTTLSDGRVVDAGPLDLSGVTATASVDDLVGASPLGKELIAAETQVAARARIGAVTVGTAATDAKRGDYKPSAADLTDAGGVTAVKVNGVAYSPAAGVVDLGALAMTPVTDSDLTTALGG